MRKNRSVFGLMMMAFLVGLLFVVGCGSSPVKSSREKATRNQTPSPKPGQVYEFSVQELQNLLRVGDGYQPSVVFEFGDPRLAWFNARIDLLVGGVDGDFVEASFRGFVKKRSVVRLFNGQYFTCGGNAETSGLPRWDELFDSCIEVNPEGKALDVYYRYEWAPPAVAYPRIGRIINLTRVEPISDTIIGYPQGCQGCYQQVRIILTVPVEVFRGRTPFFDPRG